MLNGVLFDFIQSISITRMVIPEDNTRRRKATKTRLTKEWGSETAGMSGRFSGWPMQAAVGRDWQCSGHFTANVTAFSHSRLRTDAQKTVQTTAGGTCSIATHSQLPDRRWTECL